MKKPSLEVARKFTESIGTEYTDEEFKNWVIASLQALQQNQFGL